MEIYTEKRGFYKRDYNCYIIKVTDDMKKTAFEFAETIILGNNQYNRLLPGNIKDNLDIAYEEKIRIQRTFVGKIGELAFCELLRNKQKIFSTKGMFEIFEGQENVDDFDFITKDSKLVDIKTGFLSNHKNLLVNEEQFSGKPKDYYVGIKLECREEDIHRKLINLETVEYAKILGYAEYSYLDKVAPKSFGEGLARFHPYSKLLGIDKLIDKF